MGIIERLEAAAEQLDCAMDEDRDPYGPRPDMSRKGPLAEVARTIADAEPVLRNLLFTSVAFIELAEHAGEGGWTHAIPGVANAVTGARTTIDNAARLEREGFDLPGRLDWASADLEQAFEEEADPSSRPPSAGAEGPLGDISNTLDDALPVFRALLPVAHAYIELGEHALHHRWADEFVGLPDALRLARDTVIAAEK